METVFSGIQPSGELHLGNYLGAVRNWVALQGQYRCFYCIVDYHAITQPYDPAQMAARARAMAIDVLACGVDPDQATLFVQSAVPEHTELAWVLASVAPHGELERMTQFKDKAEHHPENINAGLFMYPVLQAADILLYGATRVPVGEDQRQHLELAREIVRRFNHFYGDVFPEPQTLLTEAKRIPGTDGRKMSKSYGNAIYLKDDPETLRQKLRPMVTDPARKRRTDPGNPDVCPVFDLHKAFSPPESQAWAAQGCRSAGIGCLDCKARLAEHMLERLKTIHERRPALAARPDTVWDVLVEGSKRARAVAEATMDEVRAAMKIRYDRP
jgi:tryptophanyl-tRNA synthetase